MPDPKLHGKLELNSHGYITCDVFFGVIVKFSPRICIDLTGVPDRGWGPDPWTPLASAAPV